MVDIGTVADAVFTGTNTGLNLRERVLANTVRGSILAGNQAYRHRNLLAGSYISYRLLKNQLGKRTGEKITDFFKAKKTKMTVIPINSYGGDIVMDNTNPQAESSVVGAGTSLGKGDYTGPIIGTSTIPGHSVNYLRKPKKGKKKLTQSKKFAKKVRKICAKQYNPWHSQIQYGGGLNFVVANGKQQKWHAIVFCGDEELNQIYTHTAAFYTNPGVAAMAADYTIPAGTSDTNKIHFKYYTYEIKIAQSEASIGNWPLVCELYHFVYKKRLNDDTAADTQALIDTGVNRRGFTSVTYEAMAAMTQVTTQVAADSGMLTPFNHKELMEHVDIHKVETFLFTAQHQFMILKGGLKIKSWSKSQGTCNGKTYHCFPETTHGIIFRIYDAAFTSGNGTTGKLSYNVIKRYKCYIEGHFPRGENLVDDVTYQDND